MSKDKYFVICDSSEKAGFKYHFVESWDCSGCVTQSLNTGDYTLRGWEDKLCIERKRNVSEICQNLHEDRFYRQLERMREFRWCYLLMEFSLADLLSYPEGANLPPKVKGKIKATGPYLLKKLTEVMIKYNNIQFLFCGNRQNAYITCLSIMKRVHEFKD